MVTSREAIDQITGILAQPKSAQEHGEQIAETIRSARGYRWVGLYEVTPTDIGAIAWTGSEAPVFPRFPRTKGLCGAAVKSHAPVIVGEVKHDSRYLTTFGSTESEMIMPVIGGTGAVIGLIDVESEKRNAFGEADTHFLQICAAVLPPLFTK